MNETSSINISTSADPFLLEFGSSVSVNEDLYRELHKSCQGLDASLQHTEQEIQRAIRTDGLLKKDLGHATAEMTRLSRDCAEEVDSIAINRHTRMQLLHQFRNSFIRIIDPQRFHDRNNMEEEEGGDANVDNAERKETICTFLHVLSQTRMILQNSAKNNEETKQNLSQIKSDLKETSQNISSAEERIRSLEKARDEAQKEKHSRARELNAETQRQMSIKDACHRSRHLCGEHAKELDKLHSAKLSKHIAEQEDLSLHITRIEKEVRDSESNELAALDLSLAAIAAEIEEFEHQIRLANDIREQRAALQLQRDAVAFVAEKMEKQQKLLYATRAKFADTLSVLSLLDKEEEELVRLKAVNDEREKNEIANALQDRVTLGKEKEACAGKINELHRQRNEHDTHHLDLVAKKKSEIASIEEKNRSLNEEIILCKEERLNLEQKSKELLASHTKEMESNELFLSLLENSIMVEEQKKSNILQQREAEKHEKVANLMEKNRKIRQEAEYKLSLLKRGAERLRATQEMYQEITNKPFELSSFSNVDNVR